MPEQRVKRNTFLKMVGAAGVALGAGAPAFIPKRSAAADAIRLGLVEPITGVYAAQARNEIRGIQMAVDAWNKRGGVLGRQVQLITEDEQNNPGVGVEKTRKLVRENQVHAVFGTVSSAVSVAVSNAAFSLGVPCIISGGHTDTVNGTSCHWTTYRTCHSTWMETHATGRSIAKLFGKKWYMVTPDYAYGHSLLDGYSDLEKKLGVQIVGTDLTPLGTADFSAYITKVEGAKPSCLVLMVQGDDLINFLKQANSAGLLKRIPVAGPQAELENFWALPKEARVGYWGYEWYYKGDNVLGKNNKLALDFVRDYKKRFNDTPTARSAFGYVSADRLIAAFDEAKDTAPVKVAKAIAGTHFNALCVGDAFFRPVDHQLMWPMWFGGVRAEGTPGDPFDIWDIQDFQPADQIERPGVEQSQICHMTFPS